MAQSYQVVITPRAEDSLEQIIDYLLETTSIKTARKVRDAIEEAIASLAHMPESKGLLRGIGEKKIVYRRVLVWNYRIIFTVKEKELIVLVVEIDHQSMDTKHLDDILE